MSTVEDRLRMFFESGLPYREIAVSISLADERRLRAAIQSYNHETPDDPLDPTSDTDLAIIAGGAMTRGLEDGERDAGMWSDIDGVARALPRTVRSPWHRRARFAWRAATSTWRAT